MRKLVAKKLALIAMIEFNKVKDKVESKPLSVISKTITNMHKVSGRVQYRIEKITLRYHKNSFKSFYNVVKKMYYCGDLKLK